MVTGFESLTPNPATKSVLDAVSGTLAPANTNGCEGLDENSMYSIIPANNLEMIIKTSIGSEKTAGALLTLVKKGVEANIPMFKLGK